MPYSGHRVDVGRQDAPGAGRPLADLCGGQTMSLTDIGEEMAKLRASGAFDADWYASHYGDVPRGIDPLEHYLRIGCRVGRRMAADEQKLIPKNRSEASAARSPFHKRLIDFDTVDRSTGLHDAIAASEAALASMTTTALLDKSGPLVSIIMPTFNRAHTLREVIGSVLSQEYPKWELWVCDDASDDDTEAVVASFGDARVHYLKLSKRGAAAARNAGLASARGEVIAYLDSDNIWHPKFLSCMVSALLEAPGRSCAYADYIDFEVLPGAPPRIRSFATPAFDHERLIKKNFIDLNSFVHRRELYDAFGGFDEALTRRQDYALVLKYTWLRDPLPVKAILVLYRRDEALGQITRVNKSDMSCVPLIEAAIDSYLHKGLPRIGGRPARRVTIISWDLCRNHFSKPFALAEALSSEYSVQLVSFRFFDEPIFPPLEGVKPSFDTAYFDGRSFPDFFSAMKAALDIIDGDVIYVVKPRLPSLGLALLANALRGTPLMLEINDLETVVSAPKAEDRHREVSLADVDLSDQALLSPYSDLWSQLMDPVAKHVPVLLTHNCNLDAHFERRSLYMRNLKDEAVYDPALYDRSAIREELGFGPDDRVILFGGLLRKHKGIYELVELVERLGDSRYKLLFAGSRPTPDQKRLVERYGERVRVLPPQDREAMARINLAADLVILWLDPDVAASHYQMPYKATDAFAMGASIIANPISDLKPLGEQGYLKLVEYGDWDGMASTIRGLFNNPAERERMRAAARRLYQRQFSYAAARSAFELAVRRAVAVKGPLPAAQDFAERFNAFYRKASDARQDFMALSAQEEPQSGPIQLLDVAALDQFSLSDPDGIAIVMPSIDTTKARSTAELLLKRAGMPVTILIAEDTIRQGFIATLNAVAARLDVKYVVYLAEDAFPGLDWLKTAYERLEETGKGLLAFNCGKWRGRIAAFGMVRTAWVKTLYGGPILFPGYKAHKADNELTVIGRVTDQSVYCADAVLVEIDAGKVFKENVPEDKKLFHSRFRQGFDGNADLDKLRPFAEEYFVPLDPKPSKAKAGKVENPREFVLHRIIGNDLFPRHKVGQSLENLKFILKHEPNLEQCEKRFIVNRIIDKNVENEIVSLIRNAGFKYKVIPFEISVYKSLGFDVDSFPERGFLASGKYAGFDAVKKIRAQVACYRLKNNYVMNNNGARNAALEDGRSCEGARWLMPFDGNCFITERAWDAIRTGIASAGDKSYFVVPMARLLSNDVLITGGEIPEAIEEPQVIFRHDAPERFNEEFPYGRRPKVEMLWRLGVPGKWDAYLDDAWDPARSRTRVDPSQVGRAGWVARLFSGKGEFETTTEDATLQRGFVRTEAILSTLRQLDQAVSDAHPARTVSVFIPQASGWTAGEGKSSARIASQLRADADEALQRGPYSVLDKTTLPPSGDPRDYWHPAPYWWPNPKTADGLPFVRRDGERVPGTRMYEPDSDKYDRTRLQRVFDDSLTLALAHRTTGENAYAKHAAEIIRRFFIDPETRMNPHLKYGQVRMGHNGNEGAPTGLIEMKDFYFLLDAARLLHEDAALPDKDIEAFKAWLEPYLEWLITSPQGKAELRAVNNHGTCYDLQVGAVAAFIGKTDLLYETLARANSRIAEQFDAEGRQPDELKRTTTAHYCCFNFQSWINLARLAGRWGVDLWSYEAPDGAGLKQGARWLLSHMGQPWPYEQIDAFDADRFLPIWFAARAAGVDGLPDLPAGISGPLDVKPVFFPHDGIRPYWNLDVTKP